jgi:hypothetical protein
MNHTQLLDKLIQIERAIGTEDNLTLQKMLMDAEQCLLDLEKERVRTLRRDVDLSALSGFQGGPASFALRADVRTRDLKAARTKIRA